MANENLSGASKENGEELSQASGNSATWDSIIYGQPTPAKPDTENYYNDPVEGEPFYFDPDAEDISENFMKDPTDFTDVALVAKRKRIAKIVGSAVLIVAVLVGGGYLGLKTFMGSQDTQQKAADEAAAPIEEDPASPTALTKPKTPLKDLAKNAPAVEAGKATASVVGSTIVTSENVSLTISNTKIVASQIECSVTLVTDFCLAARNADTADANKNLDIYFFKDAARSRIFENAEKFKKVNVSGSIAAATMEINLVSGKSTPVVTVVAPNSSGFMVALPQGTSDEDIAAFVKNLVLS